MDNNQPQETETETVNAAGLADAMLYTIDKYFEEHTLHGQIRPITRAHTRYWLAGQVAACFGQMPPTLDGETPAPQLPKSQTNYLTETTPEGAEGESPFTFRGWSGYVCETTVEGITDANGINGTGAYTFAETRDQVVQRGNVRIEIGDGVPHEELPDLLAGLYHRVMTDLGLSKPDAQADQGKSGAED